MSDFVWVVCELSDSEYKKVAHSFNKRVKPKELTEQQSIVLSYCKDQPEKLVPKYIPRDLLPKEYDKNKYRDGIIDAKNLQTFSSIFHLKEIEYILKRLQLTDKKVINFSSFEEHPFAILTYSFGAAEVDRIPGVFGNILIPRENLEKVLSVTNSVLNKRNPISFSKAKQIYSTCTAGAETSQFDDEINELFSLLPSALEEAIKRKVNIISLCLWMG